MILTFFFDKNENVDKSIKISKNRLRKKMSKYIHKSKKILLYLALLTSTKNILYTILRQYR